MASRTLLWVASLASVPLVLAGSPTYNAIFQNPLPVAPIATPARLEVYQMVTKTIG
jgi:bilirubin oxidase